MQLSNSEKNRLKTRYGSWAIVTGASSGIGRELSVQLVSAGFHLVVVARHADTLQVLEQELKSVANVQVKSVLADVSEPSGIAQIIAATLGLDIGLLIVSAGYGTSGRFVDNTFVSELNMLHVNCEAVLSLTHHYGAMFAERKRGGIVLMSSMVAFHGTPYAAHYAATKAYILTLAEGIAEELKPYGVDVLVAAPGPVETGFGARAGIQMPVSMKPSQIGVPILKALGRRTTVLPGFLSKLLVYALRLLPRSVRIRMMGKVMKRLTIGTGK